MMISRLLFAALATALLTGCLPQFDHPLPGDSPADPALLGEWHVENDEGVMLTRVSERDDGRLTLLMLHSAEGQAIEDGDRMVLAAATTTIGKQRYMSIEIIESSDEDVAPQGHFICLYAIAEPVLSVRCMATDPVIEDVEAGLLAGTVKRDEYVDEVYIHADGATVAAYLAKAKVERLFEEALTFDRAAP
ncbi:MAG: hypothetical protein QGF53_14720 [Alphaproteobacteria bacterium]|jgi:hypothetical protein|nr:hypothetical protein [Alphaproteobacteria bacterium]